MKCRAITLALAAAMSGVTVPVLPEAAADAGASSAMTMRLLRVGQTSGSSTLDPAQDYNSVTTSLALEGLLTFGPGGNLVPDLALSVSRPGPAVYVVHLREGVKFWDGNEMTSADVVASLDRYREPAFSTEAEYADVASVKATGPFTVVITLKQPNAAFESTLAWQGAIFEKSFFEKHQRTFGTPGTLVEGTGPWEIESFDPTTSEELSANPTWWGGKVNIDHISIKFFATETSEALAFRAGEIDVAFPTSADAFASTSGAKLVSVPANSIGFFGMNTKVAPWDDIHVRRAVAYALDKPELITADANPGTPVPTLIPPSQLDLLAPASTVNALLRSLPSYPYNLAKAKRELAESAYPHGFTAESDTTSTVQGFVAVTEAIAAMLQKVGINLQVKVVPPTQWSKEFYGTVKGGKGGDLYTTFNLPSPDPSSYPSFMLGSGNVGNGGWDWASYDPPEIDTLIKEGATSQVPATRLTAYMKMLRTLATDVPYVPLFIADYNMALSTKFSYSGFNQNYLRTAFALGIRAS